MNDREKLIELITYIEDQMVHAYPYTTDTFRIEETAKYLIANGVTVQRGFLLRRGCPARAKVSLCMSPSVGILVIRGWMTKNGLALLRAVRLPTGCRYRNRQRKVNDSGHYLRARNYCHFYVRHGHCGRN